MPISNFENNLKAIDKTIQNLCSSSQVLGNGTYSDIKNIMYINLDNFKNDRTEEIAKIIGEYNNILGSEIHIC